MGTICEIDGVESPPEAPCRHLVHPTITRPVVLTTRDKILGFLLGVVVLAVSFLIIVIVKTCLDAFSQWMDVLENYRLFMTVVFGGGLAVLLGFVAYSIGVSVIREIKRSKQKP